MIDGHSHLLMSSSGREKRAVADLTEVDLGVLFAGLDRLGIERVVSLVQDTTRVGAAGPAPMIAPSICRRRFRTAS